MTSGKGKDGNEGEYPPILLAGPTAVGKTEVALRLAEVLGGEIVSVDSMQVYRGMDIGTAKPSMEERSRVPHHVIDVANVSEPFDAAAFVTFASEAVEAIRARGRVPILCGGTGLYFRAFLGGLGASPAPDFSLRRELEQTALEALLAELRRKDPVAYQRIDRQNPRRVIRAVEVIRLSGKPFSELQADWQAAPARRFPFVGLKRSRQDWHRRIDARVEAMFSQGLVEETSRLLKQGLTDNPTAMQAIGYRQVVDYLYGKRSLCETIALVKTRTRQFGKHQLTWFGRERGLSWLSWDPDQSVDRIVEAIVRLGGE